MVERKNPRLGACRPRWRAGCRAGPRADCGEFPPLLLSAKAGLAKRYLAAYFKSFTSEVVHPFMRIASITAWRGLGNRDGDRSDSSGYVCINILASKHLRNSAPPERGIQAPSVSFPRSAAGPGATADGRALRRVAAGRGLLPLPNRELARAAQLALAPAWDGGQGYACASGLLWTTGC